MCDCLLTAKEILHVLNVHVLIRVIFVHYMENCLVNSHCAQSFDDVDDVSVYVCAVDRLFLGTVEIPVNNLPHRRHNSRPPLFAVAHSNE